jgi:hypothetical protein
MIDRQPVRLGRIVKCKECTINIGQGFQETRPFIAPDGRGYLCWRCYESYERQQERKARAEAAKG